MGAVDVEPEEGALYRTSKISEVVAAVFVDDGKLGSHTGTRPVIRRMNSKYLPVAYERPVSSAVGVGLRKGRIEVAYTRASSQRWLSRIVDG